MLLAIEVGKNGCFQMTLVGANCTFIDARSDSLKINTSKCYGNHTRVNVCILVHTFSKHVVLLHIAR